MIDARPFTDPANTEHDTAVMQDMLGRMRVLAHGWLESPPPGLGALVREADAAGNRTWIRIAARHYHSARLHNGVVRSPLLGDADLVVLRTRYYDFDR